MLPTELVQRQVAIAVVVAIEKAPLLLAMRRVVSGVKVEYELFRRALEASD